MKLSRDCNDMAEEWMGRLRMKGAECEYKEDDSHLKEKFMNGINDDVIMSEIMKELTAIKYTSTICNEQELLWAK